MGNLNTLRNGTYKRSSDREVGSLGSESIYTNTCQFEVRDQCFCAHFTRKGDHSRQQQIAPVSPHTSRNRVVQSIASSIGLVTQVRFLSGYQHLDYASATSLRNGSSEVNDADGSTRSKHPDREDLGAREEMEGRYKYGQHPCAR